MAEKDVLTLEYGRFISLMRMGIMIITAIGGWLLTIIDWPPTLVQWGFIAIAIGAIDWVIYRFKRIWWVGMRDAREKLRKIN